MDLSLLLKRAHTEPTITVRNDIIQAAAVELELEAEKAAVQAVKGLLSQFSDSLGRIVRELRGVRQLEKGLSKKVKMLDRAIKFFAESGNPLPVFRITGDVLAASRFCDRIGITVPSVVDPAWAVPSEFDS
jgi:lipopolysaccharide biosynthesis regulator YciM